MPEQENSAEYSQRNYVIALAVAGMVGGFAFTYLLEFTDGWSMGRRLGGAFLFGCWCAFMVTVTRVGSGFK